MTLKPIPRLILIIAVIGAAVLGINKYLETRQSKNATAPVQVVTTANDNSGVPGKTVTVAVVNGAAGGSNTYQAIVEKGVVRVSVQSPAKPFFFVENGVPQGFNYDFLKVLFSQTQFIGKSGQIKLDTDHVVDTYPAVPQALLKNDNRGNPAVDIAIDGLTFSDDDLPGVVYSIPYIDDFGYSLITSSSSSIKSIADMNGVTIGILKGDPDVKAYVTRMFPKVRIVELSDASVNGERNWINNFIKEGQVDAVVYDYPFAVAEINGTNLQFAVSKLPESDLKYKIGMRKADTQLLENINTAIRKVKASPEYVTLIKKYFTSNSLAKVRTASSNETVYVVKAGDTLLSIAAKLLDNKMRFREIESRNNLPNPNLIQIGQKLVIPKG
jgi:ABC-type amino acid transport substrate-binding protein